MERSDNKTFAHFFLLSLIAICTILAGAIVSLNLNEVEFKFFIVTIYILATFSSYLIRTYWFDSIFVKILALGIFEGICLHRLVCGIKYGEFYQLNANAMLSERGLILRFTNQPDERNFVYLSLIMISGFVFFWYSNFAQNR